MEIQARITDIHGGKSLYKFIVIEIESKTKIYKPNRNVDNTILSESITSNTYSYEVNADSAEDTFEVICTVDNGITTNSVSESQTRFYIRYLNAQISGKDEKRAYKKDHNNI